MKKYQFMRFLLLNLSILIGMMNSSYSLSASFPKSDEVITAQVQAKIAANPLLARLGLHVSTTAAVVSLQGKIDQVSQANQLVILVMAIAGVKSVDVSGLELKASPLLPGQKARPSGPIFSKDSIINSQVIGLYIREGLIDDAHQSAASIHVQTKQGVVYLSGFVDTNAMAVNAVTLAQTVPGVVNVVSTLIVSK